MARGPPWLCLPVASAAVGLSVSTEWLGENATARLPICQAFNTTLRTVLAHGPSALQLQLTSDSSECGKSMCQGPPFTAKNEYHEDHVQVRNVTREKEGHHCNQGRDIQ